MSGKLEFNLSSDETYEVGCFGCGKPISISARELEQNTFHYCRKCILRGKDTLKEIIGVPGGFESAYSLDMGRELDKKNPPLIFR